MRGEGKVVAGPAAFLKHSGRGADGGSVAPPSARVRDASKRRCLAPHRRAARRREHGEQRHSPNSTPATECCQYGAQVGHTPARCSTRLRPAALCGPKVARRRLAPVWRPRRPHPGAAPEDEDGQQPQIHSLPAAACRQSGDGDGLTAERPNSATSTKNPTMGKAHPLPPASRLASASATPQLRPPASRPKPDDVRSSPAPACLQHAARLGHTTARRNSTSTTKSPTTDSTCWHRPASTLVHALATPRRRPTARPRPKARRRALATACLQPGAVVGLAIAPPKSATLDEKALDDGQSAPATARLQTGTGDDHITVWPNSFPTTSCANSGRGGSPSVALPTPYVVVADVDKKMRLSANGGTSPVSIKSKRRTWPWVAT